MRKMKELFISIRAIAPIGNLYNLFPVLGRGHAHFVLEQLVECRAAVESQIRTEGF